MILYYHKHNFLIFVIVGDLIARYLLHKLPMLKIKPFLTVPIKKDALVHFVLGKSVFSFFNVLPLFFYIPFSVVLVREGYDANGVLGWLFSLMLIVLSANFINFLINRRYYHQTYNFKINFVNTIIIKCI